VVLEERAGEYFDMTKADGLYPPRFRLMVTSIPEDKRDQIQAVCHQGGTGRLQAIRREWNPGYYDVVAKFGEATGTPVVLNTSYNLRGEPIVNTPQNALHTFRESGLDALAMGPFFVSK
jgi:carbamoyltransferase